MLSNENDLGEPIGRTSSPEREPNKTTKFSFWVKEGIIINPFDFVVAEHFKNTYTIGMVTEISALTDAPTHLTNVLSSDPNIEPYVKRLSSMVGEAVVFKNTGYRESDRILEVNMPLPTDQPVYFANSKMIHTAIGMDGIKEENKIPAGVILQSNGAKVPVYFDSRYLLSPEGAHINVSGISGLATKTSYLLFLLNSVYQKMKKDVAIIIFNVKHADLLHIHEKADITENDKLLYSSLNLKIEAFPRENVKYFLPRGSRGGADSDPPLPETYTTYAYELNDVWDRLDLLFSDVPDEWGTIEDFVNRFRNEWDTNQIIIGNAPVTTWDDLRNIEEHVINESFGFGRGTGVGRRIKRILNRLISHSVFVNERSENQVYLGEKIKGIKAGDVFVIDIFRLPPHTKSFVVGDVMRSIDELFGEKSKEELPAVIILIDELNTFAPKSSKNALTKQIREIASKGRSRGTVLFGAEQFKSEVDEQIIGNCSVHAIGRTSGIEVKKPVYLLEESIKQSITTLEKGELVLAFPTWRRPVKIIFPRPCCKKME